MAPSKRIKVCYVLSYYAPDYIRTKSLVEALKHLPEIELCTLINRSTGLKRYRETWLKAREIDQNFKPDVYLLGFRGHEFYWPLRWLVGETPIIIDALMSPYCALVEEKKYGRIGGLAALLWKKIEQSLLRDARLVLTDTTLHARYQAEQFGLHEQNIRALPVGAIEQNGSSLEHLGPPKTDPSEKRKITKEMSVLFYGSFLPLHGVDVIVRAARKLSDLPIRFDFVGGDEKRMMAALGEKSERGLINYTYRRWVEFDELLRVTIPSADLCLGGPFGNTPQARRVITGKTSQCLALGRPCVIGAID